MKSVIIILLGLSFSVLAQVTPTVRLNQSLTFSDDLHFASLDLAINRQLKSFEVNGLDGTIKFGTKTYPKTVLKESLVLLKALTLKASSCLKSNPENVCLNQFNADVNEKFHFYVAKSTGGKKTKFTSYYSPDLHGSRVKTERFNHAVYRKPDLESEQNYSRVEIDYKGALQGKGYEIFYVEESYFDLYLLHVQGGGRIQITNPDGTTEIKYLSFDSKNSQSFQMIYRYMIKKGYLVEGAAGIEAQRTFLTQNPDKEEEIFGSCPSYVYFKESSEGPVGLDDIPLTEGRSLAIDSNIYSTMGIINFVKTQRASHVDEAGKVVKVPFSRFFISQDTGGAIRGAARCDLYFGYGPLAEMTAYNMDEVGEQYFLVKK
jgi:membrane-bound lytic murein transglycosylase A